MPTHATPHGTPHSRRGFLTKAAAATGVAWAAPIISTLNQPAGAAASLPILVSGFNFVLIAPPASVGTMESDSVVFGFPELCTVLTADLAVNRSGADGLFDGVNSTAVVPAGTEVCSYFIRSERVTPGGGTVNATIQFTNATIVGLAYKDTALESTKAIFRVPGVNYNATGEIENPDFGVVVTANGGPNDGDSQATVFLTTGGNGGSDSIRILVTPS